MNRHPLLISAGLVSLAASIIAACSTNIASAPQPDAGSSGDDDSGQVSSGDDSGSTPAKDSGGTTSDTGTTSGDSGNSCMLPDAWIYNPTCDACQVKNCCAPITACNNDPGCLAIFTCEQNCYNNMEPDGATFNPDAAVDDAGNGPTDYCIATCVATGSAASQKLFATQNTCVNDMYCMAACM